MFNRLISCINYGKIFWEIHGAATRSTKLLGRRRTSAINFQTAAYTIIWQWKEINGRVKAPTFLPNRYLMQQVNHSYTRSREVSFFSNLILIRWQISLRFQVIHTLSCQFEWKYCEMLGSPQRSKWVTCVTMRYLKVVNFIYILCYKCY